MKTKIFQNIIKNDEKRITKKYLLPYCEEKETTRTKILAEEVEKVIEKLPCKCECCAFGAKEHCEKEINVNELKTKLAEIKL